MVRKILFSALNILFCVSLHGASVLWDEATNGTLDSNPYAPTNYTYVVHPIGTTVAGVNYVMGQVAVTPYPGYPTIFEATDNAFFFTIPTNCQFTGLLLSYTPDLPCNLFGGLYTTATGAADASGNLGTWVATNVNPGTNDLFAYFGLSVLPPGPYSMNVCPLLEDYNWPTNGTVNYTLSILTTPMPPTLQISQSSNQLVLSWNTNNAAGFSLQSTTSLSPPATWTALTNPPALIGSQMVVTNAMPNGPCFFRLIAPFVDN